ncbi:MAG: hypothetical protein ABH822_02185 [Patescibacteria group bacterium]
MKKKKTCCNGMSTNQTLFWVVFAVIMVGLIIWFVAGTDVGVQVGAQVPVANCAQYTNDEACHNDPSGVCYWDNYEGCRGGIPPPVYPDSAACEAAEYPLCCSFNPTGGYVPLLSTYCGGGGCDMTFCVAFGSDVGACEAANAIYGCVVSWGYPPGSLEFPGGSAPSCGCGGTTPPVIPPVTPPSSTCGNGVNDLGENCDSSAVPHGCGIGFDCAETGDDRCGECFYVGGSCGDYGVGPGEECDPPGDILFNDDGTAEAVCGNHCQWVPFINDCALTGTCPVGDCALTGTCDICAEIFGDDGDWSDLFSDLFLDDPFAVGGEVVTGICSSILPGIVGWGVTDSSLAAYSCSSPVGTGSGGGGGGGGLIMEKNACNDPETGYNSGSTIKEQKASCDQAPPGLCIFNTYLGINGELRGICSPASGTGTGTGNGGEVKEVCCLYKGIYMHDIKENSCKKAGGIITPWLPSCPVYETGDPTPYCQGMLNAYSDCRYIGDDPPPMGLPRDCQLYKDAIDMVGCSNTPPERTGCCKAKPGQPSIIRNICASLGERSCGAYQSADSLVCTWEPNCIASTNDYYYCSDMFLAYNSCRNPYNPPPNSPPSDCQSFIDVMGMVGCPNTPS